ncbi:ATP-grasp domain-containing protein [Pseudoalteromonas sp. M8]|uniref:ATP-grasp domain-containing protein n=1 Tax=Pseudoalteromonas sp. M8 TaxID=2692624 RepID=UPI001BA62451|nr:ATP-grasp domain-containing protein [Pseudoalteromonas sp. M8]QUI70397.1 ATP-grasp domain-containing protein [Pseudoalteromonas sp. M8]
MSKWFVAVTAGRWQLCGIVAAKRLGYKVVAIDSDESALGFKYADEVICKPFCAIQEILTALSNKSIAGCLSICSDAGMTLAGLIIDHFNLPGPGLVISQRLTSKKLQRSAWQNIPSLANPSFICSSNFDALVEQAHQIPFPAIIKPVDSAGSRGVQKLTDKAQLTEHVFQSALQHSKSQEVILEAFVTGEEYTVESLQINGQSTILAITEKSKLPQSNYTVAYKLETATFSEQLLDKIHNAINNAYSSLGYFDGIGHAEILLDAQNNITIVEVAGRGGGFLVFESLIPKVTGLEIVPLTIRIACGEQPKLETFTPKHAILEFFPSSEGTISAIANFEQLANIEGCEGGNFFEIGDKVTSANCDGARLGYLLTSGVNSEHTQKLHQTALTTISYEVTPNESN